MSEGEILIYNVKERTFQNVKGVQKIEVKKDQSTENQVHLYINDDCSIIILRYQCQDFLWMWTKTKENMTQAQTGASLQVSDQQNYRRAAPGVGIFRSNSYDRAQQSQQNELLNSEKMNQQPNQNQQESQIKGSWLRVLMKDLTGPFQHKQSIYPEGFDLKFTHSTPSSHSADNVKVMQVKLYSKQEYFGNLMNLQQVNSNQLDESMMIELSSQNLKVNFVNKAGNQFESSSNCNNFRSKISCVDFIGQSGLRNKTIITKLDNQCQLAFTVLNSPHMLYCQVFFSNFDTSFSVAIKLFDFVSPDDCPTFDNRGKTNLCIDDVAWTNNDAFVVMIFNSCSFAVLPRLGSSLIAIFNPTILNISQKMVDQFQHYKNPRKFNELILPMQIQQKHPQCKQQMLANQKTITTHPFEETMLISDGQLCFIFRIEFEPELTDLFSKQNMSFFFVRFCISMERLAVDQDILEKIPQLLTNKLPLFEFEKNAELDEEEDPGQVIMTASQINPYEHGQKRMETNQSFNAEFTLDCQVVLLNLKHLLMALRWNKSSPINYYQWLITVVNDCFFYFLKNSEPIYAFHALRIAEAYCKKTLFATETDSDIAQFDQRNQEFHSQRTDFTDFNQLKQFFEAIHDMYDYHNTREYMNKNTSEKLMIKFDLFDKLPLRINRGSGNWRFQFTKNYALLVYYSLIQFRNYQAANFNILFLVFACYILQRYLDTMFQHHLQSIIEIVYRNFQMKKKSDDYELFLGKSGKNFIIGPPEKIKAYQDWTNQVMKFSMSHIAPIFEQENIENLMDISINELNSNVEKIEKNVTYLGQSGKVFQIAFSLNQQSRPGKIEKTLELFHDFLDSYKDDLNEGSTNNSKVRISEMNIGTSLYLITEIIRRNDLLGKNEKINIFNLLQGIYKIAIQTSPNHCTNYIDGFSQSIDSYFKCQNSGSKTIDYLTHFGFDKEHEKCQFLAVMYFYLNDLTKASNVLDQKQQDLSKQLENQLFKILILSISVKHSLKYIDQINQQSKDLEGQPFICMDQILKFQQKSNCIQTIRKSLVLLKSSFPNLYDKTQRNWQQSSQILKALWAAFTMIPQNASNILKEGLSHEATQQMTKILKYLKLTNPLQRQNLVFNTTKDQSSLNTKSDQIEKHILARRFFQLLMDDDSVSILHKIFANDQIEDTFNEKFEQVLISMVNQETGHALLRIHGDDVIFVDDEHSQLSVSENEKTKQIGNLMTKKFKKLSKMVLFLQTSVQLWKLEALMQQEISKTILGKEHKINPQLQLQYLTSLFNLALFEKYSHSQLLISKGLNIVRTILHVDFEQKLIEIFKLISFENLNRANKQKIAQILEQVKSQQSSMKNLIQQLENIMFSAGEKTVETPLNLRLKKSHLDLINFINHKLQLKLLMKSGDNLANKMKMLLFERCLQARKIFKISFDYSFYFDKSAFERRFGNIFGINDALLDKVQVMQAKREEKLRQRQIIKERGEDEPQLSFRETNHNRKQSTNNNGSNLMDSQRSYSQYESPGRSYSIETEVGRQSKERQQIPSSEIAKGLMRNRQLGNPETPKGGKEEQNFKKDLARILNQGNKQPKLMQRDKSQDHTQISNQKARNDSVDFENREIAVAKILKFTKRRNSVRKQFVFPQQSQEEKKKDQKQAQRVSKCYHRKGQMSVNPSGVVHNFNLRNQKYIENNQNYATVSVQNQQPVARIGPPPGLPKAGQSSKRQTTKSTRTFSTDQKASQFTTLLQKVLLKMSFRKWASLIKSRQGVTIANNSSKTTPTKTLKENNQNQGSAGKKAAAGVFNLLFVKKEGDSYTISDVKEILKKKQLSAQETTGQTSSQKPSSNQVSSNKNPIVSKPFEFIRVQQSISGTLEENKESKSVNIKNQPVIVSLKKHTNDEQHTRSQVDTHNNRIKSANNASSAMNPKKKPQNKEQYLKFMQKFKQISEKIDKVQKEANQLNQDFSKLQQ